MAARAARGQSSRTLENPQQSQARLQSDRLRHRVQRASEDPQQSQARLQSDRLHHRVQRASETPQQSQTRQEADQLQYFRLAIWINNVNIVLPLSTMVSGLECAVLQCGNPITHPLPRLPSTFHLGITTEPVKVDRMTEDSSMQRMTEAGDEYVADALTNMQPHHEYLVSHLTDAIRGLAVPRAEEALISPFDGSHATSSLLPYNHPQRSTPASISHFKVL
ncbi:hypothetical protein LAZ67_6003538 [Cordylochernes scorpioides]|uniref:Uncharacterized protein n=1 Tax=Cordylochernes scorpioides TaxID=51811 RepID=A0ABY6KL35_9ARAC|nr:hypothetical protein LAZ67_6003538 [Cordylochernes scorpioides]